eukprot:TRINITY_DN12226_c0_g1_i1.p1 TRINITY_DN12226_c0_g1~~TRINITY_DN12226_c0_g1_i1.p1  ORF type:complete len:557 (-),score=127.64 TRINITY_DN12226_c0_g1_i1:59-1606(-)
MPDGNYGHRRYVQEDTGRYYYVSQKTGKASWKKPADWASPEQLAGVVYQLFAAERRASPEMVSPDGIPYSVPAAPVEPPPREALMWNFDSSTTPRPTSNSISSTASASSAGSPSPGSKFPPSPADYGVASSPTTKRVIGWGARRPSVSQFNAPLSTLKSFPSSPGRGTSPRTKTRGPPGSPHTRSHTGSGSRFAVIDSPRAASSPRRAPVVRTKSGGSTGPSRPPPPSTSPAQESSSSLSSSSPGLRNSSNPSMPGLPLLTSTPPPSRSPHPLKSPLSSSVPSYTQSPFSTTSESPRHAPLPIKRGSRGSVGRARGASIRAGRVSPVPSSVGSPTPAAAVAAPASSTPPPPPPSGGGGPGGRTPESQGIMFSVQFPTIKESVSRWFATAIKSNSGVAVDGFMFLTPSYVCFATDRNKMAIPYKSISRIAKNETDILIARAANAKGVGAMAVVFTNFVLPVGEVHEYIKKQFPSSTSSSQPQQRKPSASVSSAHSPINVPNSGVRRSSDGPQLQRQ